MKMNEKVSPKEMPNSIHRQQDGHVKSCFQLCRRSICSNMLGKPWALDILYYIIAGWSRDLPVMGCCGMVKCRPASCWIKVLDSMIFGGFWVYVWVVRLSQNATLSEVAKGRFCFCSFSWFPLGCHTVYLALSLLWFPSCMHINIEYQIETHPHTPVILNNSATHGVQPKSLS